MSKRIDKNTVLKCQYNNSPLGSRARGLGVSEWYTKYPHNKSNHSYPTINNSPTYHPK